MFAADFNHDHKSATSKPNQTYSGLPFVTGADVFMPAQDRPAGKATVTLAPRGTGGRSAAAADGRAAAARPRFACGGRPPSEQPRLHRLEPLTCDDRVREVRASGLRPPWHRRVAPGLTT